MLSCFPCKIFVVVWSWIGCVLSHSQRAFGVSFLSISLSAASSRWLLRRVGRSVFHFVRLPVSDTNFVIKRLAFRYNFSKSIQELLVCYVFDDLMIDLWKLRLCWDVKRISWAMFFVSLRWLSFLNIWSLISNKIFFFGFWKFIVS